MSPEFIEIAARFKAEQLAARERFIKSALEILDQQASEPTDAPSIPPQMRAQPAPRKSQAGEMRAVAKGLVHQGIVVVVPGPDRTRYMVPPIVNYRPLTHTRGAYELDTLACWRSTFEGFSDEQLVNLRAEVMVWAWRAAGAQHEAAYRDAVMRLAESGDPMAFRCARSHGLL